MRNHNLPGEFRIRPHLTTKNKGFAVADTSLAFLD
jgi:hypothetical protein